MLNASVSLDAMPATPFKVSPIKFAMWIFLASESMFFTGVLGSYIVLRVSDPDQFHQDAQQLSWIMATVNTVVLIASSLTMALAVAAARAKDSGKCGRNLLLTMLLGMVFLAIKVVEYSGKIGHGIVPGTSIFFASYYTLTGCHALHMVGGLIPVLGVWRKATRGKVNPDGVEALGLYWHFVDVVWILLFPLLYLI